MAFIYKLERNVPFKLPVNSDHLHIEYYENVYSWQEERNQRIIIAGMHSLLLRIFMSKHGNL